MAREPAGRPLLVWLDGKGRIAHVEEGRPLSGASLAGLEEMLRGAGYRVTARAAAEFRGLKSEYPGSHAAACLVVWPAAQPPVALPSRSAALDRILGQSPAIREAKELAIRIARLPVPVLLEGETGTGKELFARAIHELSPFASGPFVAVNCAAIPESLAESEFFGYESGAFTGAQRTGHPGFFEQAHQGTLFLDEVASLPVSLQPKLLRVLEEGVVRRLGSSRERSVHVRIISATNVPIRQLVREGVFREDLYHRLSVVTLRLPPLRERGRDVVLLFREFLNHYRMSFGLGPLDFGEDVESVLQAHSWPETCGS